MLGVMLEALPNHFLGCTWPIIGLPGVVLSGEYACDVPKSISPQNNTKNLENLKTLDISSHGFKGSQFIKVLKTLSEKCGNLESLMAACHGSISENYQKFDKKRVAQYEMITFDNLRSLDVSGIFAQSSTAEGNPYLT